MSMIFEKRGYWYYRWSQHGIARSKAIRTKDKSVAVRMQKIWDAQLEQARFGVAPKKAPVADTIHEYLEQKAATLAPGSLVRYHEHAKVWQTWLEENGVKSWEKLTDGNAAQFATDRLKTRAPKTVDDELAWVRGVLQWLWRGRRLAEMPVRNWPDIKVKSANPAKLGNYTKDEIARLREYFKFREFEPVFLFALLTGARREEITSGVVGDVRLGDGAVVLHCGKTETNPKDAYRAVAIHPDLLQRLTDRVTGRPADAPLFPEMARHSRNWPACVMMAACKELGITYRRFHGLRHTFTTYLLASGADIRQVMSAVGHKKMETTQIYAHAAEKLADVGKIGI